MFSHLADTLLPWLELYGAWGVLAGSLVEEVIAPIPSTVVILFGGFLLIPADATVLQAMGQVAYKVMLPASVGMAVGSLFPYFIARIGEKVAVDRFGALLQVDWKTVEKAQAYFEKKQSESLLLFIARAVPVIPSVVIAVFCGLIRMPVGRFVLWSFLGSLVRTFILGMVGWAVGSAYERYAANIAIAENAILYGTALAAVCGAVWWWTRHRKKRRAAQQ